MRLFKRSFFVILSLIVIFALFIFVWCNLPKKEVNLSNFPQDKNFIFLKLELKKDSFSLLDEVVNFKFAGNFLIDSFARRLFIKSAGRFFSPLTIIILVDSSSIEDAKFEYTILVKSKRFSRFLEIPLFLHKATTSFNKDYELSQDGNWLIYETTKNSNLNSFTKHGDVCLVASAKDRIKELVEAFSSERDKFPSFLKDSYNKPFFLYVNDEKRMLNFYLEEAKEKTYCDFFPRGDNLNEILIHLEKANSDSEKANTGQMIFVFEKDADFKGAMKDIRLFSQVLRRIFEANFYTFNYKLNIIKNCIIMSFNLEKMLISEKK